MSASTGYVASGVHHCERVTGQLPPELQGIEARVMAALQVETRQQLRSGGNLGKR